MNKIKKVARRLLGKESPKPYRLDSVTKTVNSVTKAQSGFCIIGWYHDDDIKEVGLSSTQKEPLSTKIVFIERNDVTEATGRASKGFQLTADTELEIQDVLFVAESTDGNQFTETLTLTGDSVVVEEPAVDISALASSDVKAFFEYAIFVDGFMYVAGWMLDAGKASDFSLSIKKDTFDDYEVIRYTRSDVVNAFPNESTKSINAGFMLVFSIDKLDFIPTEKDLTLKFCVEKAKEKLSTQLVYNGKADPMTNTQRLVNAWQSNSPSHLAKGEMFLPVLHGIYPADKMPNIKTLTYNKQPTTPSVSIIIPLYGRIDFMRYQLSRFSRTLEKQDVEIIYVLDDPSLTNKTTKLAAELEILNDFPFKLVLLSQNVGFGKANNIGVQNASADNIVLLNSDVLPKSKTWLQSLFTTLSKEDTGIVGARLLYEDETIQHDGMAPMTVKEHPGLLFNDHPKKGWPKNLASSSESELDCKLLTAACWMLRKQDFDAVGGFDSAYVLGDFEDSDLCLKIEELGKKNRIRKDIELYHLERQSQNLVQPGRWKHNVTVLNAITYNKKWKDTLGAMEEKL